MGGMVDGASRSWRRERRVVIARGSVWWTDLGPIRGSAPAKRRPVLVIQSDTFNRSSIPTCVVVAITSNTAVAEHPGNVFVPSRASGLDRDSVVNVSQLSTVDHSELTSEVGRLPPYLLEEVDHGLRLLLAV